MTKIKRITIHGFKSFAHKTDLLLDDKFNCILGPNGSGKSNVGDALCFVLGRISAKSMRAEKASNLIFNGGKNKAPSPHASVEIVFDNSSKIFPQQESEIVINRTIKKDGASIYRINGKKLTRTEVIDTLSMAKINPNGYNIILQGDITHFVDMSSIERRKIIEEISDISLYEEKKNKANAELLSVEEKLNNAEIILKERKVHLRELKKDRDQALKYKEVKDSIDSLKATNLHLQISERNELKSKNDLQVEELQNKINASESKINELKTKISEGRNEVVSINQEIEKRGEKEQLKVHHDIEDLKVELAKHKTRISTLKDELGKIKQRKDQLSEELKGLEDKSKSYSYKEKEVQQELSKKHSELKELEENIVQFKKKHKIESSQEIEKEIEDKEKLIEQKQEEINNIRLGQQELLREKDRLDLQLESIDEKIRRVQEIEKENSGQVKELQKFKEEFKASTLKLNQLLDLDSSLSAQVSNAKKKSLDLQQKQHDLNAQSASLRAGIATNQAVRYILENKKQWKGVYGTVAELGQAKKKFALPLEKAAGSKIQHIIVDSDKTASDCIKALQKQKMGSVSFIPLNKIRYGEISSEDKKLLNQDGVHDFAINLISFDSQFKKAFAYVFGNTMVVENLDVARNIGINRLKMATMDGSIAEASGVMRGGFSKPSPLSFKEEGSLQQLEAVDQEIQETESIISALQVKREANEKEIAYLRNRKAELEAESIKLEKTLHIDTDDLNASQDFKNELIEKSKLNEEKTEEVQRKISHLNKELAELKQRKQSLRLQVNELRNPRLLAQLTAFEEAKRQIREESLKLEGELKSALTHLGELIAPEQIKIQEIMKQHDKEEVQFNSEIKKLSQDVELKEKDLAVKEEESKLLYSKYHGLFSQREKLNADIVKHENEMEKDREKARDLEREINLLSLKNAEVKAKLAGLEEEFNRYKNAIILENKTQSHLEDEIKKAEVMLSQMSAVNLKALEVYEEIETEYNKLVEKKDSLDKEKIDVLTMMNEIETKKKENFMRTFDKANENFQRIFANLFKKGKAALYLENPDKPFDDGLSVKVKFAGNRFMDMKSLSGGEKTLTALSFIFAIQEYQPASFYILDEIDAALDKQNSDMLSRLIRSYANNAQYLVISHNDAIISEADTLYGVSMQEGVSKVTSVRI
ncbi:chromosome segregation protein SMC [Candidatus Woesearchaeota archaeon]|nr:chromosome segregation protein SMC [Candidatus Woesearchaeota archaeon]